jgi:hypothetical protein
MRPARPGPGRVVAWIRRRGRRRLHGYGLGGAGREAGSGTGGLDGWRGGRGGGGGEPAPAQVDDGQPGEHVG